MAGLGCGDREMRFGHLLVGQATPAIVRQRADRSAERAICMHTGSPDQSKSGRRRALILFVAVALAESVFLFTVIRERGLFDYLGLDYRGSRAAGEAILEHGLAGAYDSQLLEEIQRPIYDEYTIA